MALDFKSKLERFARRNIPWWTFGGFLLIGIIAASVLVKDDRSLSKSEADELLAIARLVAHNYRDTDPKSMAVVIVGRRGGMVVRYVDKGAGDFEALMLDRAAIEAYAALTYSTTNTAIPSSCLRNPSSLQPVQQGVEQYFSKIRSGVRLIGGGYPVYRKDGVLVGSIGIAGLPMENQEAARLAANAFGKVPEEKCSS